MKLLDAVIDRLSRLHREPWWAWPLILVGFAAITWICALLVEPRPDEWSYLFDMRLGDTCAFTQMFGVPCPSCGMTRSFAHAARLHLAASFLYNPGGVTLFAAITAAGAVGLVRLLTRDPDALVLGHRRLTHIVLAWTFGLYLLPWILRLLGINPLP